MDFFNDRWICDMCLGDFVHNSTSGNNHNLKAANFSSPIGEWKWNMISFFLPNFPMEVSTGVGGPIDNVGEDQPFWYGTSNGVFPIKSTYELLYHNGWNDVNDKWKLIWALPLPQ